jgi:hypothetical protein
VTILIRIIKTTCCEPFATLKMSWDGSCTENIGIPAVL